jgi:hypothetical protein
MTRYRVTLRVSSVEVVDANNPYQAAVVARDLHGDGVEIADVRPASIRSRPEHRVNELPNSWSAVTRSRCANGRVRL